MKWLLVLVCVGGSTVAVADDDPGMQLMSVMMRCPAISADGKHVAIYSNNSGGDKDANMTLTVFGAGGAVEQRIPVVPPVVDAARAKVAAARITKLLDDGGFKRMGRVARVSGSNDHSTVTTQLSSGDVVIDVKLANHKLEIHATRAGTKLAPITRTVSADAPCKAVDAYSLANTMAGYDSKTHELAFSITAEHAGQVCVAHDVVIELR